MKTKAIHNSAKTAQPAKTSAVRAAKKVRFKITAPNAKSVSLVGSFTQWEAQPIPLAESEPGHWEVEAELPPGRHEYLFLTDRGEWLRDPEATDSTPNPWGGSNSTIEVVLPI